jgi:hypothetical protein
MAQPVSLAVDAERCKCLEMQGVRLTPTQAYGGYVEERGRSATQQIQAFPALGATAYVASL